ncbi:hypothetical protein ACQJBY_015977 [Aegilops geniculata]
MRGDDEMMSAMTNELLCHGFRRGTVGKPWRRLGPAMELVLGTPHRAPSRCSSLLAAPPHLQNKEAQVLANRENSFTEAPTTPKEDIFIGPPVLMFYGFGFIPMAGSLTGSYCVEMSVLHLTVWRS